MTLDHLREIALIQISQAQRTNTMTKLEKEIAAYRATGRAAFIKRDRKGAVKAVSLDGRTMTVEAAAAKMRAVLAA